MMPTVAAGLAAQLAHQLGALFVVFGRAVRKVHAHDVDAGAEHALEDLGLARGGTERGDDLGAALPFVAARWHARKHDAPRKLFEL